MAITVSSTTLSNVFSGMCYFYGKFSNSMSYEEISKDWHGWLALNEFYTHSLKQSLVYYAS